MPPRDPTKVQLDFPLLVADLIRQLNLTGSIGVLDFSPQVVPVFIVGDRDLTVEAVSTLYLPAETTEGQATNPILGQVIADTGQLPAGDYDLQLHCSIGLTTGGPRGLIFEHRNAANGASLTRWFCFAANTSSNALAVIFAFRLAEDERIRLIAGSALTNAQVGGTIMFARRPVP